MSIASVEDSNEEVSDKPGIGLRILCGLIGFAIGDVIGLGVSVQQNWSFTTKTSFFGPGFWCSLIGGLIYVGLSQWVAYKFAGSTKDFANRAVGLSAIITIGLTLIYILTTPGTNLLMVVGAASLVFVVSLVLTLGLMDDNNRINLGRDRCRIQDTSDPQYVQKTNIKMMRSQLERFFSIHSLSTTKLEYAGTVPRVVFWAHVIAPLLLAAIFFWGFFSFQGFTFLIHHLKFGVPIIGLIVFMLALLAFLVHISLQELPLHKPSVPLIIIGSVLFGSAYTMLNFPGGRQLLHFIADRPGQHLSLIVCILFSLRAVVMIDAVNTTTRQITESVFTKGSDSRFSNVDPVASFPRDKVTNVRVERGWVEKLTGTELVEIRGINDDPTDRMHFESTRFKEGEGELVCQLLNATAQPAQQMVIKGEIADDDEVTVSKARHRKK